MGGANHATTFGADKDTGYKLPPSAFTIPPKGHYLHDPARRTFFEEARVQSIMEFGMDQQIHVVNDGGVLYVQRGGKRVIDGQEAERRCKAKHKPVPLFPYRLVKMEEIVSRDMQTIENFHRQIPTPADYALEVARMRRQSYPDNRVCYLLRICDRKGVPLDGKAAKVACDDYEKLSGAAPALLKQVAGKKIGKTEAVKLAKKGREVQEKRAAEVEQGKPAPKSEEKRPKSLPAEVLLRAADDVQRSDFYNKPIACALLKAAAGQPRDLEILVPQIAAILASARKGKPAA